MKAIDILSFVTQIKFYHYLFDILYISIVMICNFQYLSIKNFNEFYIKNLQIGRPQHGYETKRNGNSLKMNTQPPIAPTRKQISELTYKMSDSMKEKCRAFGKSHRSGSLPRALRGTNLRRGAV